MADFGPLTPDLPPFGHAGLVVARNVYPASIGYRPIKSLSSVTSDLGTTWKGGGSFIDADGTTVTVAGADDGLHVYDGSAWSNEWPDTYSSIWQFAQFGPLLIGVNGSAPVKYTISSSTGALLGGSPPSATMIAIVRDFVFLAGDSGANSSVYWSASNNAEGWTIGTDQADFQQLPDGGPITAIAGGEYGLVFQEAAIHRFSYVGAPVIFQRDKVSEAVGCIAPGAVAMFGRLAFFLSPRGFYAFNDGELRAIGRDKIDNTFWASYDRSDVTNSIRCVIDPNLSLVIWSMPERLFIYNWELDRWTDVFIAGLVGLSTGINASVSLEDIDTLFPAGGSGDIDAVPYSLDDPIFKGGGVMLTLVKSDDIIYSFGAADNLEATFRMARQEIIPGRDARVRKARIVGDMTSGITLAVDYSRRLGDTQGTVEATTIRTSGDTPIRVSGRYLQPQLTIAAGADWTYVRGLELEVAPGGRQ